MRIDEHKLRKKNAVMASGIIIITIGIYGFFFFDVWIGLIMIIAGVTIQLHARRMDISLNREVEDLEEYKDLQGGYNGSR